MSYCFFISIIILFVPSFFVSSVFSENFDNSTQQIPTGIDRIDAEPTSLSPSSIDIDVAILDSGVDVNHPDLNVLEDRQVNFVGTDPSDNCGHGTHVAGIIGAKDNNFGVIGVAPNAKIWNIKVMEKNNVTGNCEVDYDAVIDGLKYLLNNSDTIDVANLSISFQCVDFCNTSEVMEIENLINQIIARGVVVVVSAANDGINARQIVPAMLQMPITVSAISDTDGKCGGLGPISEPWELTGERMQDDTFASMSNYGTVIDIAAPGVDINSTLPGATYGKMSGTSFATPHVTGTVALIIANQSDIIPSNVRNMLLEFGSNQSVECDGQGYGYFINDQDPYPEPLLYAKKFKTQNSIN
jgi:subtilisin family serine protease